MPAVNVAKSINKRRANEQILKNQPLMEDGKLCLCVVHIKELVKKEFDEIVLDFPTKLLKDEEERLRSQVPPSCFAISELTQFYFTKLGIVRLSSKVQMLQNLKVLNLTRNNLKKLPETLTKITTLEDINVSHNDLEQCPLLPSSIVTVDLCSNLIMGISKEFQACNKLDRLILHTNRICSTDPEGFNGCDNLKQLDISHNKLDEFPVCLNRLESLEWLDISHNSIKTIPEEFVVRNKNIRGLYLAATGIHDMDSLRNIAKFELLENLNMNGNGLKKLVDEFENLKWLQQVWLSSNQFTEFPACLTKIKYLGGIDLNDNDIKVVDNEAIDFGMLARCCVSLELSGNGLQSFPEQLCKFNRMTRLNLSLNSCTSISKSMAEYFKKFMPQIILETSRSKSYDDGLMLYGNPFGNVMMRCVKAGDLDGIVCAQIQDEQGMDTGKTGLLADDVNARMRIIE